MAMFDYYFDCNTSQVLSSDEVRFQFEREQKAGKTLLQYFDEYLHFRCTVVKDLQDLSDSDECACGVCGEVFTIDELTVSYGTILCWRCKRAYDEH